LLTETPNVSFEYDRCRSIIFGKTIDNKEFNIIIYKKSLCRVDLIGCDDGSWIDVVWKDFRRILDSCSTELCNCTAMDSLVRVEEGENKMEEIAKAFIYAMEFTSDGATYIRRDFLHFKRLREALIRPAVWANQVKVSTILHNNVKINHLYGKRFMELFSDRFDSQKRISMERLMDVRYRKAEIVYEGRMAVAETKFKRSSMTYTLVSIFVAIVLGGAALLLHFV